MDQRPSDVRPALESDTNDEQKKMNEIRSDMQETRASLVNKLETLQERVACSVENTVESVQDVVQTVKRTLDITYQVEQRPWVMVGAAFLAGTAVGFLTNRGRPRAAPEHVEAPPRPRKHVASTGNGHAAERPARARTEAPSLFKEELDKLKGMAVGVGMALARDWLKQAAPALTEQIEQVMDSATRKLGGVPVEGPPFEPHEPHAPGASRFDGLRQGY